MNARVMVLGGGVAGLQVASVLGRMNVPVLLVEQTDRLGGRVRRLATTFPMMNDRGFADGAQFVEGLLTEVRSCPTIEIRLGTTIRRLEGEFPGFRAVLTSGSVEEVVSVVVATGFEPFDPTGLEEYGYGRYPGVVTASELEWMLNPRGPTGGVLRRQDDGRAVKRLGIVFCVGSRNRRIGAPFCSRICCSYSTKQALTVLDRDPSAEVFCFYMDVRTYDRGFEEMYSRAQERGIRFIRGRVASCKQDEKGSVIVRAENTLLQRPVIAELDMVSLATGMRPNSDIAQMAQALGIERAKDGFYTCGTWFRYPNDSTRPGVYLAGCATGMKPIRNCMTDGAAAAARVMMTLAGTDSCSA